MQTISNQKKSSKEYRDYKLNTKLY